MRVGFDPDRRGNSRDLHAAALAREGRSDHDEEREQDRARENEKRDEESSQRAGARRGPSIPGATTS
jgi:hypothetical protein